MQIKTRLFVKTASLNETFVRLIKLLRSKDRTNKSRSILLISNALHVRTKMSYNNIYAGRWVSWLRSEAINSHILKKHCTKPTLVSHRCVLLRRGAIGSEADVGSEEALSIIKLHYAYIYIP